MAKFASLFGGNRALICMSRSRWLRHLYQCFPPSYFSTKFHSIHCVKPTIERKCSRCSNAVLLHTYPSDAGERCRSNENTVCCFQIESEYVIFSKQISTLFTEARQHVLEMHTQTNHPLW